MLLLPLHLQQALPPTQRAQSMQKACSWCSPIRPAICGGGQVWWDLLIAITIGLFLIAPRARAQGMNLPLWTVFVVATASIGLLAMAARLFWLEQAATSKV